MRCSAWLIALTIVGSLSGCGAKVFNDDERYRIAEETVPTVEPIAVRLSHDIRFGPGEQNIRDGEKRTLDQFLVRNTVSRQDAIVLVGRDDAVSDRIAEIYKHLAPYDLRITVASGGSGAEPESFDTVRVVVHRTLVRLPNCPDWSGSPSDDGTNRHFSNHGCATAINLGLMVARPSDLARGRNIGSMDGEYGSLAIQRYRLGETKPLITDSLDAVANAAGTGESGNSGGSN